MLPVQTQAPGDTLGKSRVNSGGLVKGVLWVLFFDVSVSCSLWYWLTVQQEVKPPLPVTSLIPRVPVTPGSRAQACGSEARTHGVWVQVLLGWVMRLRKGVAETSSE